MLRPVFDLCVSLVRVVSDQLDSSILHQRCHSVMLQGNCYISGANHEADVAIAASPRGGGSDPYREFAVGYVGYALHPYCSACHSQSVSFTSGCFGFKVTLLQLRGALTAVSQAHLKSSITGILHGKK